MQPCIEKFGDRISAPLSGFNRLVLQRRAPGHVAGAHHFREAPASPAPPPAAGSDAALAFSLFRTEFSAGAVHCHA